MPPRSTKVTEKLVLLPETVIEEEEEDEEEEEEEEIESLDQEMARRGSLGAGPRSPEREREGRPRERMRRLAAQKRLKNLDFGVDNEASPLLAEEERFRRRRIAPEKAKSYAERLPKARRAEKLPRVTAYCTAQAYKMSATAAFVKEYHGARTKLYDDCLYTAYHLPLVPGVDGYRVRSSPILKSAEGRAVLDEEIERNEQRDYHEEYFVEEEEHSVAGQSGDEGGDSRHHASSDDEHKGLGDVPRNRSQNGSGGYSRNSFTESKIQDDPNGKLPKAIRSNSIPPNILSFAEMFVFSYGVVVFWNFTERQEKDVLADLAFSSNRTGTLPIATNPLPEEDFETEEFHFEYSTEISRPRVYNDMITLRSGDHMIKLAISHGIAQSTKLSLFEEAMARQMSEAKDVPRRLALTGHLGMKREEVFRILGKLFKSRVEVNLCESCAHPDPFLIFDQPANFHVSIKHARRAQFLLGLRTDSTPPLHRRAGISRDKTSHPGSERTLSRLPRPD
jgi:uncharacterized Rmd1/YagE family protein